MNFHYHEYRVQQHQKNSGQEKIKEILQKQAAYNLKTHKDFNQELAYFIWKAMMPFQIVEQSGVQRLFVSH